MSKHGEKRIAQRAISSEAIEVLTILGSFWDQKGNQSYLYDRALRNDTTQKND